MLPAQPQTGDPRTDPDICGYVAAYFDYPARLAAWQTWYQQRIDGGPIGTEPSRPRAQKRPPPTPTRPTIAHLDTLGRPFLTVAHNRVVCRPRPLTARKSSSHTRVELDIEGNQREVIDAKDRVVMRYDYDMLGTPHPPGQHGGGRALDAERRGRQAHPRLGQPGLHTAGWPTTRCAGPSATMSSDNGQPERLVGKDRLRRTP